MNTDVSPLIFCGKCNKQVDWAEAEHDAVECAVLFNDRCHGESGTFRVYDNQRPKMTPGIKFQMDVIGSALHRRHNGGSLIQLGIALLKEACNVFKTQHEALEFAKNVPMYVSIVGLVSYDLRDIIKAMPEFNQLPEA